MRRRTKAVSWLTIASLIATSFPARAIAAEAPQPVVRGNAADLGADHILRAVGRAVGGEPASGLVTRAEYEACQTVDEEAFRTAIAVITAKALAKGLAAVDYTALVAQAWRNEGFDAILDARVDIAVAEVRDETSWGGLISSLADKEKAQQLATAVAERVYRSEPVKAGIENLSAGVAREIGKRLELAGLDAAEPALRCMQAFLGPRYGSAVARIVTAQAEGEFAPGAERGAADVTSGDLLKQSSGGLTGAAVLLMRRQLGNIAGRIGQRLVGSILSRLVSVVAGGIGLVLIAKDIWDLRHGVLPIVADEMKSQATKEKVREELGRGLAELIQEHVKEIATKTADHVVDIWRGFRRAHAMVLDVAENNDRFRGYLDTLQASELARLDEVTALVVAAEGQAGLLQRLDDGTLDEAVRRMSPSALEIARTTRSLETGLRWAALAGGDIDAVVASDLYRRARVDELSPMALRRILALDDRLAMTRLASVSRGARDTLFDLATDELKSLARALTEAELETLAGYLAGLAQGPRERILKALSADPGLMRSLAAEPVRRAVVASRDQSAAVEIMLRPQGLLDPAAAYRDMVLAWNGEVSPRLIWEKHPAALGALALVALLLLLLLRRLLMPRRVGRQRDTPDALGRPANAVPPTPSAGAAVGPVPRPSPPGDERDRPQPVRRT